MYFVIAMYSKSFDSFYQYYYPKDTAYASS